MEYIKNFFECYFNQSAYTEELDSLLHNLKKSEHEEYRFKLITELHLIIQTKSYKLASKIARKYGGRIWDIETTEEILKYIYDRLIDRPATLNLNPPPKCKIVYCPTCTPDIESATTYSLINKATITAKNVEIYFCKPCKLVWTTEDIRADNAQDYKEFMKSLGLKGFWNELHDVDLL